MNERILKIIDLLARAKDGLSGVDLANSIGVSARTIRSDIKMFSAQLGKYGVKIHSTTRHGYQLKITDNQVFKAFWEERCTHNEVKIAGADDRIIAIIKRLLYNALQNRHITQMELADEIFVSLSTLKILLKEVGRKLGKYSLQIVAFKNKGITVDGGEAQIRYCISEYIFDRRQQAELYTDAFYQTLFPDIDLHNISDIILQVIARREIKLTDTALKNLLIHTVIAVQRAISSHSMIYTAGQVKRIEKETEFIVAGDIAERLYQDLQIDIAAGEVYYIAQHLIASKKYTEDLTKNTGIRRGGLIKLVLEKVRQASGIDFSNDDDFINGFTAHLDVAIPRMKFAMNIRNEALELIKKEYPMAFQFGLIAGRVIEEAEKVRANEDEIGYIAIHFGAALSRMGVDVNADCKKVLIVCANGVGMAILIRAKLSKHFTNRIEVVQTVAGYQLTPEKVDSVDLVLTTVPILHIQSDKIIHIRYLLNNDEIMNIEERIFGKITEKEILFEFFRKDTFFYGMQFQTRWDVLDFLTQNAINKKIMSETTKLSIWEREEASATEIGNLVAIPHPMVNEEETSSISVIILKKPIIWDEEPVQVVFLINIAKDKFSLWETVFLKLFDYLVKENGVKTMVQEPSYDKFIRHFIQKF